MRVYGDSYFNCIQKDVRQKEVRRDGSDKLNNGSVYKPSRDVYNFSCGEWNIYFFLSTAKKQRRKTKMIGLITQEDIEEIVKIVNTQGEEIEKLKVDFAQLVEEINSKSKLSGKKQEEEQPEDEDVEEEETDKKSKLGLRSKFKR